MSTQPVFIPVGDLADGFAPDSHILPFSPAAARPASCNCILPMAACQLASE
jgi:hypothetical protein